MRLEGFSPNNFHTLLELARNQKETGESLDKLVTKVKKYLLWDIEIECVLLAILQHPNVKRKTVCRIIKSFDIYMVRRAAIGMPYFDDDIFQIIRHHNDKVAIDMAIESNKLSALSLISLGTHESEWIRKHALAKLSRMPTT